MTNSSLPAAKAPPSEPEAAPSQPDLAQEIVWSEREDVYRPAPIEARRFMETLSLAWPPEIKPGQALLFVRKAAFERLQAHLKSDLKREQGGLLVGQAFRDETLSAYLLVIEEA
ncbi:MAG TPA: hypothetical protein VKT32_02885, partial [Chthonomonadaceae bacterium]|nr:hypothetical protein [Chthonomonadaceae bacterium]